MRKTIATRDPQARHAVLATVWIRHSNATSSATAGGHLDDEERHGVCRETRQGKTLAEPRLGHDAPGMRGLHAHASPG